ncbi:uncharacterized protein LOC128951227 [Oppia nitens]|uniref:uncharacterized protein LOC128951227 n=1 Tax=Oppia nitens TaxID=1686743 RepID=UPI0023D9C8B9|nr:uncharacterized protein LOC128951227 [Oppia nitens]
MSAIDKNRLIGVSSADLDRNTCSICLEIYNNPLVTPCCNQTYCSQCIHNWLQRNHNCPNDRKALNSTELIRAPESMYNFLDSLLIKCKFIDQGCGIAVKRSQLAAHEVNCVFNAINPCPTCGLFKETTDETHNCVKSLQIVNQRLIDRINNTSMESMIKLARQFLNFHIIEIEIGLLAHEKLKCIEIARDAISNETNNTYRLIAGQIFSKLTALYAFQEITWHCILYEQKAGHSMVIHDKCMRIKFGDLTVEMFTIKQNYKSMKLVIDHAKSILCHTIEEVVNMDVFVQLNCINIAVAAIREKNTYKEIADTIHYKLNPNIGLKRWHSIVFAKSGGESLVFAESFIRLSFGELIIEIFCAGNVNTN